MPQHMVDAGLPVDVLEELATNYTRVQAKICAVRIWDRQLTSEQKRRLGSDLAQAYRDGGTVGMWMRLHEVTAARAVIDLAILIGLIDDGTQRWLLRETGEYSDDPEEALRMAMERADLVLTEQPRAVYWMGTEVEVDWYRFEKLWAYFLTLCESATQSRWVDASDFGDRHNPDNHIKLKSRLTTSTPGFPSDLGIRINSENGGRQRLDIAPQRIRIIRAECAVI